MRDLRIDRNMISNGLSVIAVLALIAGVIVMMLPKVGAKGVAEAQLKQRQTYESATAEAKSKVATSRKRIDELTWKQPFEEIGPLALGYISLLAKQHGLKLVTFRPQKPEETESITQLPFLVALEGSYPDVIDFSRELENPKSKLALNMIQLNGSDGITDRTNVTIGVVAYSERPVPGGTHGKTL